MTHLVLHSPGAGSAERIACGDLRADLARVTGAPAAVAVAGGDLPEGAIAYRVGTAGDGAEFADVLGCGYACAVSRGDGEVLLAGRGAAGVQRAVYGFAREVLGVDPAAYWTGIAPEPMPGFVPSGVDLRIEAPAVPVLCYFDNDNDELANLSEPYLEFDRATWKALIDTLVRWGYNAIDLHDHLGRSEFYRWPEYRALRPDYRTNLELIDWAIDCAHARGMQVQIPMYLAWEFAHLGEEEAASWERHGGAWRALWRRYLDETPLGKGDLFLDRPRSQLWDYEYTDAGGRDAGAIMTEVFTALRDIVLGHNPRATLVCDLYAHGQELFLSGRFAPPRDYLMLWPDDGWCNHAPFPQDTRGYRFGTYLHAGFWLNHAVHDPYPQRIEAAMRTLCAAGAGAYCLVNGQTFRPYLLNLEAFARAAQAPRAFRGAAFQRAWCARHFGAAAAPHADDALRLLHEASGEGYVRLMYDLMAAIDRPGDADRAAAHARRATLARALAAAGRALAAAPPGARADFCHDHLALPIRIYLETLDVYLAVLEGDGARAAAALRAHLATRAAGDRDPRWRGWYDPARRRPNGGFPEMAALEAIGARR